MFGFRYMQLADTLSIQDQFHPLIDNALSFNGAPANPPNTFTDMDRFGTSNNFYGLQIGGRAPLGR